MEVAGRTEESEREVTPKEVPDIVKSTSLPVLCETGAGADIDVVGVAEQTFTLKRCQESDVADGSQEDVALYCVPCDREDIRQHASGFCLNCEEHLCALCHSHHKKAKPSKHHVLLDKDNMPMTRREASDCRGHHKSVIHDGVQCQLHRQKTIEFFCSDHNVVLCYVCSTLQHGQCKIEFIPDISKEFSESKGYEDRMERIETLLTETEYMCNNIKNTQDHKEKCISSVIENIEASRSELNEILNTWEAQIKGTIAKIENDHTEEMESVKQSCSNIENVAEFLARKLEALREVTPHDHNRAFIEIVQAEQQLEDYEASFDSGKAELHPVKFRFIPNGNIKRMLGTESNLGEVNDSVVSPDSQEPTSSKLSQKSPRSNPEKRSLRKRLQFFQKREC